MEAGPAGRAHTTLTVTLALAGAIGNVTGAALFAAAAPYVGFVDLARPAFVGLTMAAAALVLALVVHDRVVGRVLAVGSLLAAAPTLAIGWQQTFAGWVAVDAVSVGLVPAVFWVALAFPDGRLPGRTARLAVGIQAGLAVASTAVQMLVYDPGNWGWCGCVANPGALGLSPDSYPGVADGLIVAHAVTVTLGTAAYAATRLRHRPRDLEVGVAFVLLGAAVAWVVRDVATLTSPEHGPAWVGIGRDVALVVLPVLYVAGSLRRRPSRAHVADLLLAAREENDPARLRELVGRALGDPRATVLWWDPALGGYRDPLGAPVDDLPAGPAVLPVATGGHPIALVVSGRLADTDASVRDSVEEALRLAAENRRLTTELQATLEQVHDSRARILTASDEARRKIERDLHDGAQQLLISTGIKLNLASAHAGRVDDTELAGVLDEASDELNRALAELRQLASGIAPTSLAHGSLENALQELALRSPVPTTVRVIGTGDPGEPTGSTIYFVVAECLTNIAKHASSVRATVEVDLGEQVRVRIGDDGTGGATLEGEGTGLRGLVDRVEARGGTLAVVSGETGTIVTATLPRPGAADR